MVHHSKRRIIKAPLSVLSAEIEKIRKGAEKKEQTKKEIENLERLIKMKEKKVQKEMFDDFDEQINRQKKLKNKSKD